MTLLGSDESRAFLEFDAGKKIYYMKDVDHPKYKRPEKDYRNFWIVNNIVDIGMATFHMFEPSRTLGFFYLTEKLLHNLGLNEVEN
jgi:hypothetical protein